LITFQELAVSNAYEVAALAAVLERKGLATQPEVLEEVRRLKTNKPDAR
jgi:DNA-binding transcriptional regulator WhiA